MIIVVEAVEVVPRKPEDVFAVAAADVSSLARFFRGYAPFIPGIASARIDDGGPVREGALRSVRLTDESTLKERVLAFEAPRLHRYDMAEMNALQRTLCTNMVSEWRFEDLGGATRVTWRYEIHPRGAAMTAPAWVTARLFRRAMQRCLRNLAAALR